ncbi:MAG: DUF2304 domain-containing protein [Eubacteriales bacterium]
MIGTHLRITLILAMICYFILILIFLKRKAISLKYTLLWIFAGVFLTIIVVWPELLLKLISLAGITSSMNGLFVIMIGFIVAILMSITSIVSKQSAKIRQLTQTVARLEKRIRELEE